MARSVELILLLGITLLAFSFHSSNALKCYQCNSHHNPKCAEEKPPEELAKDCPAKAPGPENKPYVLCRKILQNIEYEVNGLKPDMRIIRSCGWDNSSFADKCYKRSGFGGGQEVCSCATDKCNSSDNLSYSGFLLISVIGFFYFTL